MVVVASVAVARLECCLRGQSGRVALSAVSDREHTRSFLDVLAAVVFGVDVACPMPRRPESQGWQGLQEPQPSQALETLTPRMTGAHLQNRILATADGNNGESAPSFTLGLAIWTAAHVGALLPADARAASANCSATRGSVSKKSLCPPVTHRLSYL